MRYDIPWSLYNPVKTVFAPGSINKLPSLVNQNKGLIVTSPGFTRRGLTERVRSLLGGRPVEIIDDIHPNPDIEAIEAYWSEYRKHDIDWVVGVGGGSVLDTAKALSYLLCVNNSSVSLKEYLTNKTPPVHTPLMMVAIPTTAGTGSEVTSFATIWDTASKKKYSLATNNLYPSFAVLDPELTLTLSKETTIISALDALSHAFESIWNLNANPVTIVYAANAISLVLCALPMLLEQPQDLNLRSSMLTASFLGGLCIASTRTALAHSISYPLTAHLGVPHGLACGFTLPALLDFNAVNDDGRFSRLAGLCDFSSITEFQRSFERLYESLGVRELMRKYNMKKEKLLNLVPEMVTPERAGNNLRAVEAGDVKELIEAIFN